MSMAPILRKLVAAKQLFVLPSLLTAEETVPTMYVSAEIFHDVAPPFAESRDGMRLAEFRAYLDAFTEGAELSVAENPETKLGACPGEVGTGSPTRDMRHFKESRATRCSREFIL